MCLDSTSALEEPRAQGLQLLPALAFSVSHTTLRHRGTLPQVEERLEDLHAEEFEGIPSAELFFEDKVGGAPHSCSLIVH